MLEKNRIHLGDCLELMKQIPDKSVNLTVIDPPYNINKAQWDNWKKPEEYINWLGSVFLEIQRILKDNGSFYFFHNDFLQIVELQNFINKNTNFIFKNFIVWNKKFPGAKLESYLSGYNSVENLRNYCKFAEYLLFYTFQDETGLSKIQGACCYPIREYLRSEIIRAKGKINFKEINSILGTATNGGGVASAILSTEKLVPSMITKEHYEKLRDWLNSGRNENFLSRDYKYLQKEFEFLRQEYEELRYTYNNLKTHHSVWNYDIAEKKYSEHITPKPTDLIINILKHSSNPGDLVLDCFSGSGTTAIAAHRTNRKFICIEKDPLYYADSVERLRIEQQQLKLF